ncbi:hypothetical protein [Basilea psittacipulmonis]|nr:hypothetical protein [Basilea psittacipulmonis]
MRDDKATTNEGKNIETQNPEKKLLQKLGDTLLSYIEKNPIKFILSAIIFIGYLVIFIFQYQHQLPFDANLNDIPYVAYAIFTMGALIVIPYIASPLIYALFLRSITLRLNDDNYKIISISILICNLILFSVCVLVLLTKLCFISILATIAVSIIIILYSFSSLISQPFYKEKEKFSILILLNLIFQLILLFFFSFLFIYNLIDMSRRLSESTIDFQAIIMVIGALGITAYYTHSLVKYYRDNLTQLCRYLFMFSIIPILVLFIFTGYIVKFPQIALTNLGLAYKQYDTIIVDLKTCESINLQTNNSCQVYKEVGTLKNVLIVSDIGSTVVMKINGQEKVIYLKKDNIISRTAKIANTDNTSSTGKGTQKN